MATSKRSGGEKQEDIWIAHTELAVAPGHPFYKRLNELLEGAGFDEFVEGSCGKVASRFTWQLTSNSETSGPSENGRSRVLHHGIECVEQGMIFGHQNLSLGGALCSESLPRWPLSP